MSISVTCILPSFFPHSSLLQGKHLSLGYNETCQIRNHLIS
jgi:hypothetical protein